MRFITGRKIQADDAKDHNLDEVFRSFDALFCGINRIENTELRAVLLRDVMGTASATYRALPETSRVSPARRGTGDNASCDRALHEVCS